MTKTIQRRGAETQRKERPILFSGAMVRALLAGAKTQTRRVGKCQMDGATELAAEYAMHATHGEVLQATYAAFPGRGTARWALCECPFGIAGHRLWVRETYYQLGHWVSVPGVKTKTGRMKWKFIPQSDDIEFDAPPQFRKGRHHKDPLTVAWHKRLGRFMPRKYSRITLEITAIRVERLQDISEADAKAEGCEMEADGFPKVQPHKSGIGAVGWDSAIEWYSDLWESINGTDSWDKNPWVWVVSFKRAPQLKPTIINRNSSIQCQKLT